MQAHIVLAHPEDKSFNAHLSRVARHALEAQGWSVSLSDLYAVGFDPCERSNHYRLRQGPERFDVQAEQLHASLQNAIPDFVANEIARLDRADLIILQYPMWWHLPPAILKGWMDRVLVFGEVYASTKRFEKGRFVGRRAMLSVTAGTSRDTYAFDGRSGDIDMLLWPVNFSLAFVGYTILSPFVAFGVEAGLKYSDPSVIKARLKAIEDDYSSALARIENRTVVPFNHMAEWGPDGRIKAEAKAYSPFVRHRQHLELD